jgi:hypothetical protein
MYSRNRQRVKGRTANIVLAIVGLTVVNSTFVFLLGICASVELTFFKYPTIANTPTVTCHSLATCKLEPTEQKLTILPTHYESIT